MNQIYGYIRVSSQNQKEDRQRIALESLQIPKKNIFLDKQSGKISELAAAKACNMPLSSFRYRAKIHA